MKRYIVLILGLSIIACTDHQYLIDKYTDILNDELNYDFSKYKRTMRVENRSIGPFGSDGYSKILSFPLEESDCHLLRGRIGYKYDIMEDFKLIRDCGIVWLKTGDLYRLRNFSGMPSKSSERDFKEISVDFSECTLKVIISEPLSPH